MEGYKDMLKLYCKIQIEISKLIVEFNRVNGDFLTRNEVQNAIALSQGRLDILKKEILERYPHLVSS